MSCSKLISFAEIVHGRDSTVRVTADGMLYAVDLVMVMTGSSRDDAGKTLRRLSDEIFQSDKLSDKNVGGSGSSKTKVLTLEHAIELVMVLPGKTAKETRVQFANIIRRYIGGDSTLVPEIEANAASTAPLAQLARAGGDEPDARRKRERLEDLEILQLERDIQRCEEEIKAKRIQNFHASMDLLTNINPAWRQTDPRFRLKTEDMVKNIVSTPVSSVLTLTNGPAPAPAPASLSISQLVQELGGRPLNHSDAISAGKLAVKRFRGLHGTDPIKHRQWVDGAERVVNSYTETDRAMLTAVLRDLGFVRGAA